MGLMCLPFSFGSWAAFGWPVRHTRTGAIGVWVIASTFVGLGLSLLLLLSSFGAYRLRRWGRDGMLAWAIVSLVYGLAGVYFWGRFLVPSMRSQYPAFRGPDMVSGLIAWAVGTIYAALALFYLTRPRIKAVFTPVH